MTWAEPPAFVMMSAVCCPASGLKSRMAMWFPSSARRVAMAWPMPEPAPVITAVFIKILNGVE